MRSRDSGEQIGRNGRGYLLPDFSWLKLIVWDLDNTFWAGVLSEGEVCPNSRNIDIVQLSTDMGIMNSICSKNDWNAVWKELEKEGYALIRDYFVFSSIDWSAKGNRLKQLIEDMALRPENVLFIDDEAANREEAVYMLRGIQTAGPEVLKSLAGWLKEQDARDPRHRRLAQYKILEKKRTARAGTLSNRQFLLESDIRVAYIFDCKKYVDRITELIQRTNQLNFTKLRVEKEEVEQLLNDDTMDCAVVRLQDRFGDYGIVGFYAIEKAVPHSLRHFLFSCRSLGMGVEQYTYAKLGYPPLALRGETAVCLSSGGDENIDWIREDGNDGENEIDSCKLDLERKHVLLKGPCDIDGLLPYLGKNAYYEMETNYVDNRGVIVAGSNHSEHLYEAFHTPKETIRDTIRMTPFLSEGDFVTYMFQEAYDVVIYSTLTDGHAGMYCRRDNGMRIAFGSCKQNLTDPGNWERFINGEYINHNFTFTEDILRKFSDEYVFLGSMLPEDTVRNLEWMRDKLPPGTKLILLLGSEIEADENNGEFAGHAPIYKDLNAAIRRKFQNTDNVVLINFTDYITGQDCFAGATNHFSKLVYHRLAERLMEEL